MKYFLTGAVASAFFLMGSVLLYGATGSLDIAVIGAAPGPGAPDPLALAGAALLLLGFLFKMSVVPFHQWTPGRVRGGAPPHRRLHVRGHQGRGGAGPHAGDGAWACPRSGPQMRSGALAVLAVLTLVLGNLAALAQTSIKRMLAYSSISHAGYLLLGFVAGTPAAYAGMLFYLLAYLAMNMGAFGVLSGLRPGGRRGRPSSQAQGPGLEAAGPGHRRQPVHVLPGRAAAHGRVLRQVHDLQGTDPAGARGPGGGGRAGQPGVGVLLPGACRWPCSWTSPPSSQEREAAERPPVLAPLAGATVFICGFLVLVLGLMPGHGHGRLRPPCRPGHRATLP